MRFLLVAVCFLCAVVSAFSNEIFSGKVVAIVDGNVLEVQAEDGARRRLSLAGIDCPEPGQPYSDEAKRRLEKTILNKEVKVEVIGKNRWGHHLAVVTVAKNNSDPRIELLEQGLAWTAEKDPDTHLETIRLKAQEKKRGLWNETNPTAPWIYRRQQTMMRAKSS